MEKNLKDKFFACLMGGAIGDALGAPIEFMPWEHIQAKYGKKGLTDYVPAYGRLGAITDDTQLTIATAIGLTAPRLKNETLFDSVREEYLQWYLRQTNPANNRAPGNATMSSLHIGGGSLGKKINDSKGAGAIMRSTPIGLNYYRDPIQAFDFACQAAAITHGHPTGYIAAGAFAFIIAYLAQGVTIKGAVSKFKKQYQGIGPKFDETFSYIDNAFVASKHMNYSPPAMIAYLGRGWIAEEALAIAIYLTITAPDFKTGILRAVNHSGDSDTTGAIAGNLLGLIHWREFLMPDDPPGYSRMDQVQYWITNNEASRDIAILSRKNGRDCRKGINQNET